MLGELSLAYTDVQALQALAACPFPALHSLDLQGTSLAAHQLLLLEHKGCFARLRKLRLAETEVTARDLQRLSRHFPTVADFGL